MMSNNINPSYKELLKKNTLTLDGLKQLLEADSSWVNQVTYMHLESPLHIVLTNRKCTSDIVKLLLQYNSNINCMDRFGDTCLLAALIFHRDEAIIKVLLENGANVNIRDRQTRTPLCVAVSCFASENIIKLLLDAKCPPNACGLHGSLIHCALRSSLYRLTTDFLDLLIAAKEDLSAVNENGRSPLCLALQSGQDARAIEMLMTNGGSCEMHDSLMLCATDTTHYPNLKTDVVQLLLKKKAAMDKRGCGGTPLQMALSRTRYEFKAIKLMVDHSSFDANASLENHGNLLHLALDVNFCKWSVVQLLIDKGVRVDEKNMSGMTPIEIPLRRGLDCRILKILIVAGASIDLPRTPTTIYLPQYSFCEKKRDSLIKFVLKCSCLENVNFNIHSWHLKNASYFPRFADDCRNELQRMELLNLFHYHTLRDFARRPYFTKNLASVFISTMKSYELNQLLRILSDNVFPIYFDILVAKTGRIWMEAKLKEIPVYTINIYTTSSCAEGCIVLNY